jgi:hypothetical protein
VRERRWALAGLQARRPAPPEAYPARQPVADCPGAVRYASEAAGCPLLWPAGAAEVCWRRPAVRPEEAQSESAPLLRAARQPAASGRARPSQVADRVRCRPAAMACRAQPSARRAQARLQPGASAQLAVSQPRAASWCAVVPGASPDEAAEGGRQPEVLAVAQAPRQGAAAVRDGAAAERQPAAARAVAEALRRAEAVLAVAEGLQPGAAPGAAVVRQREARDVLAAAQPSAVAWAAPLCLQAAARPGPSASAWFAHAMRGWRIALP